MKRSFKLSTLPFNWNYDQFLEFAKNQYKERYPTEANPFSHCIIYLVVGKDNTMNLTIHFPQDVGLVKTFIHKRPKGAIIGEPVRNIDIREITNLKIPNYKNKYYFDFVFFIFDITTQNYWSTHLWTQQVCADLRYYQTKTRKEEYEKIGKQLAEKYNKTFTLGHVNLLSGKLKQSKGIARLTSHGWIPTISLFPQPYGEMVNKIESDNDIKHISEFICSAFRENNFLENMVERWNLASLTNERKNILELGVNRFKDEDYVSPIYLLIPQIEGLITEHIQRKGQVPRESFSQRSKQFGDIIINETFNTNTTKYLTKIFINNLKNVYYKTWYPFPKKGKKYLGARTAPQRNLLLHGSIKKDYFTEENCIKLICVIDNIILLSLTKNELPIT